MPEQPNISPTEQQLLLRLDALLDQLVAAGFARDRVGPPMRLRLLALLNQLPQETSPEQLKFKISALVCQSETEQLKFYEIFEAFVARFLPDSIAETAAPTDNKPDTPAPKIPEEAKKESPRPVAKEPAKGSHRSDTVKAARSGPITVELNFRDDGYRPWNLPELEAAVRPLREKELTGAEEWDIPSTIKKTIEAGGAPHFARRRRKKAPQYLFLIEQKSARDHLAGFYADLAIELQRRDLDVEYYFYDRTPQKCWKQRRDPASYTTIDRLNASFAQSRLILVGEPDGLLAVTREPGSKPEQVSTRIHRYPSALAFELRDNWAAVAMLNTRSTALWSDAEQALHQLFPVAPANVAGLGSLMGQWQNRISFKPYYWQTECPEPIQPSFHDFDGAAETIERHIKSLKIYLGRQGYTWLCAISVYPEIYWQLTKILHDEAISAADVPDESQRTQLWHLHLLRLSRLAWLRLGYIPADYRRELRQGLPAANAAEVRRQLLEVLQLDENKPPEGSYAEKDRAYTVALFDHERYALLENPDKERLAAMQEKLRKDVLDAGVAISDIEDAVGRSLFRSLPEMPAETIKQFWVLWVDDTPNNNRSFQEKASKEYPSLRFVNVTSTTGALETLQKQSFDLIISDVSRFGDKEAGMKMMPRLQEAGVAVPVVFFTHPNYVQKHQETLRSLGAIAVVTGFKELEPILDEAILNKLKSNREELAEVNFLEALRQKSRAVCRVMWDGSGGGGTGFLLEGNYLLTGAHLFETPEDLPKLRAVFNIVLNEAGILPPTASYRLSPDDFIYSPIDQLDFIWVKIIDQEDAPLSQWGFIELETDKIPNAGTKLWMSHHAFGKERQTIQGKALGTENQYLYFVDEASKLPGAGGAPVFNQDLKAVGMYRAYLENQSILGRTQTARSVVLIRDIWAHIQSQQPQGEEPVQETPTSEQTVISGQVADRAGEVMIGASVLEKGTTNGTITDIEGNFALQVNNTEAVLVVNYTGFNSEEVPLNGRTKVNVTLSPDSSLSNKAREFYDAGVAARENRNYEAAEQALREAAEIYNSLNDLAGRANVQHEQGKLYMETLRFKEAEEVLNDALSLYSNLDFGAAQAFVHMDMGKLNLELQNFADAENHYVKALDFLEELSGDASEDMIEVYLGLASIAEIKGEYEKAKKQLFSALELAREADLKPQKFEILTQLGDLNMAMNDSAQAVECYADALNVAPSEEDLASTYERIGDAEKQNGAYESAASAMNQALAAYQKTEDKNALSRIADKLQQLNELNSPREKTAPPAPEPPVFESAFTPGTMKLFILCSQEDETVSKALNKHLAILRINKLISVFNSATDIVAGEDWKKRLEGEINAADYVLPIVSVNLLNSDYSYDLLANAMQSGKKVVPILAKKVDMGGTGLEKLKTLPSQARWISDFKSEDEAYSDIVAEIRRLLPTSKSQTGESIVEPEPDKPKTNISAQQVRDLISRARLGDALKLLREAMPDNSEVLTLQARLSELERGERLGILDRRDANVTRNQITAAALELTRDLPGQTAA